MYANFAAVMGLPAYTFKGIYKELQKYHGSSVQNYIVAARTAQGYDEWTRSKEEERLDAVRRWHDIQLELVKEKHRVKHYRTPPPCRFLKNRHLSNDENTEHSQGTRAQNKLSKSKRVDSVEPTPLQHAQTYSGPLSAPSNPTEFEEAIQMSVAATSKGDPNEDALIEKAIRASVTELQASKEGDDDEALQKAIQASVAEAASHRSEHQRPSLARKPTEIADLDFDDSGIDTDEDENIKIALASSEKLHSTEHRDEELDLALKASKEEHEEGLTKQKTEEEIVLEYVKKQSLAEEEYRKSIGASP